MDADLRRRWEELTALLGVDGAESTRALRDLWRRYDEPHRAYHTLAHVRHVLEVVAFLRRTEPVDDVIAVRLAAWFHDIVHVPGAPDNEAASAAVAADVLGRWGVPDERIDAVRRLVMATRDHIATMPDERVLVDADLAILAADPQTYELYRRGVRVEYGDLDEATWRTGRTAFLERLLDRDPLFATATMRERGEAAARRNVETELAALRGA